MSGHGSAVRRFVLNFGYLCESVSPKSLNKKLNFLNLWLSKGQKESTSTAIFRNKLSGFKEMDFKVKLGSIVESDTREYYANNRFSYLEEKLTSLFSDSH